MRPHSKRQRRPQSFVILERSGESWAESKDLRGGGARDKRRQVHFGRANFQRVFERSFHVSEAIGAGV